MQVCETPGEPAAALADTVTELKLVFPDIHWLIVAINIVGFGVAT